MTGSFVHYDGTSWSEVDTGIDGFIPYGLWGSSSSDVYIVGFFGIIAHYNGTEWSSVNHSLGADMLIGIHGASADEIYVVGDAGTIWRYLGVSAGDLPCYIRSLLW